MKKPSALSWIRTRVKREIPLLLLLTVCNALFALCTVFVALVMKGMIDAAQLGNKALLLKNAALFLAVLALEILLRIAVKDLEVRVSGKIEMRLKGSLYSTILSREYSAITKHHTGDLLTRLTADVTVVSDNVTLLLPNLVSMLTQSITAFIVICSLDYRFALLLLAAGLCLFGITMLFRGRLKKMHKDMQESDGKLRAFLQETMESLLAIQVFGVRKKTEAQADALQNNLFKAKMHRNHWGIAADVGLGATFNFGVFFTLLWSGLRLCAGQITFGTLTALLQLVNRVQVPLTNLSGLVPRYYSMISSAERLMEIEALPEDSPKNESLVDEEALKQQFKGFHFQNVDFAYGENAVLKQADFTIHRNEFIAISGISGIGKSTLLKLLLGVLTPQQGTIYIETENQPYKAGRDTRGIFSYVPQGNLLFSGTVRDNLCLIRPEATQAEVEEAVRLSCADSFVYDLPEGLDTVLGEGGKGLSEGQLQRLAVGRAILSGAPVLLLDEATSALDEQTEKRLLENLRAMQNKTCILISHKKAALEICDRELVIQDGSVHFK